MKTALIYFLLLFAVTGNAQKSIEQHKFLYKTAYQEIKEMLEDQKPVSFKRAVFLMENAFLDGKGSYEFFNKQILNITVRLKQLITEKHIEQYKTAGNWAAFTYMTDSIPANGLKPYTYDFQNFLPDKDPAVCFVTKLLTTGKGNCVSLPYLYKILVEEIGASANLSLAPFHCFIKHKDEAGKWVNLEMTSGSFARDEWIMQQCDVTVEQIKSGIYLNALSQKESLALVLKDLAVNYQFQFGVEDFELGILDTGLKFFPTGINLYLSEYEHYRKLLLESRKKQDKIAEQECITQMDTINGKLAALSYKKPSIEEYTSWVKENGKSKKTVPLK